MSEVEAQHGELLESQPAVRSGVRIDTTAKGMPQPRIAAYEGVTEEEMQRLLDLAIRTYETAARRLNIGPSLTG